MMQCHSKSKSREVLLGRRCNRGKSKLLPPILFDTVENCDRIVIMKKSLRKTAKLVGDEKKIKKENKIRPKVSKSWGILDKEDFN